MKCLTTTKIFGNNAVQRFSPFDQLQQHWYMTLFFQPFQAAACKICLACKTCSAMIPATEKVFMNLTCKKVSACLASKINQKCKLISVFCENNWWGVWELQEDIHHVWQGVKEYEFLANTSSLVRTKIFIIFDRVLWNINYLLILH